MGGSRFTASSYDTYASNNLRSASGATLSARDTFTAKAPVKEYQAADIKVRESRDSEANPNSRAIIMALDFSSSMAGVIHEMVNKYVPNLMGSIIEVQSVSDPHLMAIGVRDYKDGYRYRSALQATRFEADYKVSEQLQKFSDVGVGGGGNQEESYAMAWALS